MDQSLKGATPIRNELTKISSACSPFWKEPSRQSHQIENWRWQEQNKQLKRMGVENNPIQSLLKRRKQQERQRPPLEESKSHIVQTWHRGPPRNKEIPKIDQTPY